MPESTCLHIQDRESGPIRVVDIPWISVRIGRAAYCEVRLPEPELADEVCRLQRRAGSWQLVVVDNRTPIWLDGERVERSCPLPFDVPFAVGPFCLTLRRDRAVEPDWRMCPPPAAPRFHRNETDVKASGSSRKQPGLTEFFVEVGGTVEPMAAPAATEKAHAPAPEAVKAAESRERWETRWRAASAALEAAPAPSCRRETPSSPASPTPGCDRLSAAASPAAASCALGRCAPARSAWAVGSGGRRPLDGAGLAPLAPETGEPTASDRPWKAWIARENPVESFRRRTMSIEPEMRAPAAPQQRPSRAEPERPGGPPTEGARNRHHERVSSCRIR